MLTDMGSVCLLGRGQVKEKIEIVQSPPRQLASGLFGWPVTQKPANQRKRSSSMHIYAQGMQIVVAFVTQS
jgi:hypothetical protein